jgi:hypothetical protein
VRGADYAFGPRDARAVSELLALAPPEVVCERWARALRHSGFPSVQTLPQLVAQLNFFAAPPPSATTPKHDPNEGITHGAQEDFETAVARFEASMLASDASDTSSGRVA